MKTYLCDAHPMELIRLLVWRGERGESSKSKLPLDSFASQNAERASNSFSPCLTSPRNRSLVTRRPKTLQTVKYLHAAGNCGEQGGSEADAGQLQRQLGMPKKDRAERTESETHNVYVLRIPEHKTKSQGMWGLGLGRPLRNLNSPKRS